MNKDRLNNAFDIITNEIKEDLEIINKKSNEELDETLKNYSEVMSKLNEVSNGELSMLDKSNKLNELLLKISDDKNYAFMPDLAEINKCIKYLKENNYTEMLTSIYYNLASIYDDIGKENTANYADNSAAYYYTLAIEKMAELVKSNMKLYCESFGTLLCSATVFFDRTKRKVNIDIDYIKLGWESAINFNNYELAYVISRNFSIIFDNLNELEKSQEIGWLLLKTGKEKVDKNLDYNLKELIGNAQGQSNSFRKFQGNYNKQIAEAYFYAGYFAECSDKESSNYRNKQIALNYYWYCCFTKARVDSEYAKKAYSAALKVPFDKDCREIIKEIRNIKKANRK